MTQWAQKKVTLKPDKSGIYLVTKRVLEDVPEIRSVKAGIANFFLQTPDGALTINENADPTVRTDLDNALDRIVEGGGTKEGAASKTSLVGVSLDVPIHDGRLALGTWQGLYLCEWAGSARGSRDLLVTLQGIDVPLTRKTTVNAKSRGCHLITPTLEGALNGIDTCQEGVANFFIRHTSASLTINENADPTVRTDMEAAFNHICPESWNRDLFEHTMEGDDDMPGHVKSTLVGASVTVPVSHGSLDLGTWQGLYLNEHRDVGGYGTGHAREVVATVVPSSGISKQVTITVSAPCRGLHDITADVATALGDVLPSCAVGTANLCIKHTSASLTINAARDGSEGKSLESMLNHVVPEKWNEEFFEHTYEGPDDMPGHVKSTLMGAAVTIPIAQGALGLGQGQAIYLCEHRNTGGWGGNMSRQVTITMQGSPKA